MKMLGLILTLVSMTSIAIADQKDFGSTGDGFDCTGRTGNSFYRALVLNKNYRKTYDITIWKQKSAFTDRDYKKMANGLAPATLVILNLVHQPIPGGSSAQIKDLIYFEEVDLAAIDQNRAGNQATIRYLNDNDVWENIVLYCSGLHIPGR